MYQKNNYLENLREGKEREKRKMYVTRPLSLYRKDPTTLSLPPPETCNTGYLVITDEESEPEMENTCCFGTFHDPEVRKLPLPQNKLLKVVSSSGSGKHRTVYSSSGSGDHRTVHSSSGRGDHRTTSTDKVWFIPVLDQPLSSNRYYVIKATGKHEGQAYTCSKESDRSTCFFGNVVNDVKSRSFDHRSIYQQVEIFRRSHGFTAKSVAPDGFSPTFLSRKGWRADISTSYSCPLGEALGLDVSLRRRLPELNFPVPNNSSTAVVVGKWYCPCVFIKDGSLKDQMKNSMFYEMTLEQHWEQIYAFDNDNTRGNVMVVSMSVQKEAVSLFGKEAVKDDDTSAVDGVIWFRQVNYNGEGLSLGLSAAIVDKMRWLQEEGGWEEGGKIDVMVEKVEEFTGDGGWKRFGCFVLVERFALKRMDGTMLLTCDYRNVQQIQSKWE